MLQPCDYFSVQECIELRLRRLWLRITEDPGNINRADSFVNGLDIHEYHYSFKDKFKFDYDYDDLNGRRGEDHRGLQGLVVSTASRQQRRSGMRSPEDCADAEVDFPPEIFFARARGPRGW